MYAFSQNYLGHYWFNGACPIIRCHAFCIRPILIRGLINPNQSSENGENIAKFAMNYQSFSVKLYI